MALGDPLGPSTDDGWGSKRGLYFLPTHSGRVLVEAYIHDTPELTEGNTGGPTPDPKDRPAHSRSLCRTPKPVPRPCLGPSSIQVT